MREGRDPQTGSHLARLTVIGRDGRTQADMEFDPATGRVSIGRDRCMRGPGQGISDRDAMLIAQSVLTDPAVRRDLATQLGTDAERFFQSMDRYVGAIQRQLPDASTTLASGPTNRLTTLG
jgi:hypothetical protein